MSQIDIGALLRRSLCVSVAALAAISPVATAQVTTGALFEFVWQGTTDDWSSNGAWDEPGWPAAPVDAATIRVAPIAYLSRDTEIGELTISSIGQVRTSEAFGSYQLVVRGPTTITAGGRLGVWPEGASGNSDFDTDDLTIGTVTIISSVLTLNDGAIAEVDEALSIGAGGRVEGSGELRLFGAEDAVNDGLIAAMGGSLTVRPSPGNSATIDLDGTSAAGRLSAADGARLVIDADLSDDVIEGNISLSNGAELAIANDWTYWSPSLDGMTVSGDSLESGGDGSPSVISGGHFTLLGEPYHAGTIDVFDGGVLRIDAESSIDGLIHLNPGSNPSDSPATLIFNAPTHIHGQIFAGTETVVFNAPSTIDYGVFISTNATVEFHAPSSMSAIGMRLGGELVVDAAVDIMRMDVLGVDQPVFDWDGPGGLNTDTIITPQGVLSIDVGQIDEADDQYDGSLCIDGGTLDVNVDSDEWTAAGPVDLTGATVSGDRVRVAGALNVHAPGTTHVTAPFTLAPSGSVDVESGAVLRLAGDGPQGTGDADFEGGTITGSGEVLCDAEFVRVSGPTVVNMPAGAFNLNGASAVSFAVSPNESLLIVAASVADSPTTTVAPYVSLFGTLSVDLTGTNECVFNRIGFEYSAISGSDIRLLGPDRVVIIDQLYTFGDDFVSQAPIRMTPGSVCGSSLHSLYLLGGDGSLPNVFETGALVFLDSDDGPGKTPLPLVLGGWTVIEDGVTFDPDSPGPGEHALVRATGVLELRGDFDDAGILLELAGGTLELGATGDTHTAAINRLVQDAAGTIEIDISGSEGATSHDSVILTEGADSELLGTLSVAAIDGYAPQHADAFEIIRGLNGVPTVDFSQVSGPERVRAEVIGDSVWVRFLLCDADMAEPYNVLDFADVLAFLIGFGAMDPASDLAPPMGTFDFDDVLAFLVAFGAGCP